MGTEVELVEPLIVFLDANIVLEGKPVAGLPWEELEADGTIRVLIVPAAMEEIDAKKRDGRLGMHARSFNRLIAASVTGGCPTVLRDAHPRVELGMATCSRIDWDEYDELDPNDGDSRIVAEALNARGVASSRRLLVSHDIKPLAYAVGRNLPVHQPSDTWLRPAEPSPKDKEIQRLKQQVADLRKSEPSFHVEIDIEDADPLNVLRILPLGLSATETLSGVIRAKNPKKKQPTNQVSTPFRKYDTEYDRKYEVYLTKTVPKFVASFNRKLEMLFNQRLLSVRVRNCGPIRADHLVLSIRINDGWLNERVVVVSPTGPAPPEPRSEWLLPVSRPHLRDLIPAKVGRHDFETMSAAERSSMTEFSCADFRSGQEFSFDGAVLASSDEHALEVTVKLTAANLHGERSEVLTLAKRVESVSPEQLVDLHTLEFRKDAPLNGQIDRLVEAELFDELEWDDDGDKD